MLPRRILGIALLILAAVAWRAGGRPEGAGEPAPPRDDRLAVFEGMAPGRIEGIAGGGGDGRPLDVRVARSPLETSTGFQYVPADRIERSAVWFILPCGAPLYFHMRNVLAPLDVAFMDRQGQVLETALMEPGDPERLWPAPPGTCYALEVAAGRLSRLGIKPGVNLLIPPSLK